MNQELVIKLIEQLKIIANGVNNIWPIIASFSVGFIALIVGIIGIFQDRIRVLFTKPKLLVSSRLESPDCCKMPLTSPIDGKFICYGFYFRLKIENIGNYRMEDVEVMITELLKFNKEINDYEKVKSFLPQNLVWSHTQQQLTLPQSRITMPKIQPGLFKYLDLGYIRPTNEELKKIFNSNNIFIFDVMVHPNNLSEAIYPGKYKLKLFFTANNMRVYKKDYLLEFKDELADTEEKMFKKIVKLEEI